ncbi:activating transcription factor 7-interacting protein 1 [Elysia marginata]|uniref:Activating transcription factor 7-interacting protein 1 n=1 Tax=Elysia marginata TaxID=1093978 RepID=A0AAV4I521_9GAST|nr:activating transcription factor 7-interacting protein 1 [Elysia marginata]
MELETAAAVVNGQGDCSAKILSECNSEEVASILENIANIVDDTPDIPSTNFSHDKCNQNNISKDALPLKSVWSEANQSHGKDENSSKQHNSDIEMIDTAANGLSSQGLLSSASGTSALEESMDLSLQLSKESTETSCHTSSSMELEGTDCLSTNTKLATPSEQDVLNALDSAGTSPLTEEQTKPDPRIPPVKPVSSSFVAQTSDTLKTVIGDCSSLNSEIVTNQNTSCESSQAKDSFSFTTTSEISKQTNGVPEEAKGELDPALPKVNPNSSAKSSSESNLKAEAQSLANLEPESINGVCSDTHISNQTNVPSSSCSVVTLPTTSPPNTQNDPFKSTLHLSNSMQLTPAVSIPSNIQQQVGDKNPTNETNSLEVSVSDESEIEKTESPLQMEVQERIETATNVSDVTDDDPSKTESPLQMEELERIKTPAKVSDITNDDPSKTESPLQMEVGERLETAAKVSDVTEDDPSKTESPLQMEVQERTETAENVSDVTGDDPSKTESMLQMEDQEKREVAANVSEVKDGGTTLKYSYENMNGTESNKDDSVILEDACNIQILESSSIAKTDDFIEGEQVVSEVQFGEKIDTPKVSRSTEADKVQNSSDSKKSYVEPRENIPKDSVGDSTSCVNKKEIIDSSQQKEKEDQVILMDKQTVEKIDGESTVMQARPSECLDAESDVKEHYVVSEDKTNPAILIDKESGQKTNDGLEKLPCENTVTTTEETKIEEPKLEDKILLEDKSKGIDETMNTSKAEHTLQSDNKLPDHEKKPDINSHSIEASSDNVKKRSFSIEGTSGVEPKRQKLDDAVKEDVLETTPSDAMEVIDSDDDIILADDLSPKAQIINKEPTKSSKDEVSKGSTEESKEIKTDDLKPDKDFPHSKIQNLPPINLSSQVLQAFISARIKAFIKKQKQQQIDKLNQKISVMQSSTSLWKETAKHLERSVKEVTVLNQGVEKRRAHVNACKKLSSRTVGTQVNDDKVKSALSSVQPPSQSQSRGVEAVSTNSSLMPSALLNPPTPQQPLPPRQWTYQQYARPPPGRSQVPPMQPSAPVGASRFTRPSAPSSVRPPPPSEVVNLIDLTDDDEVSKKSPQPHPPAANALRHPSPLTSRNNVTSIAGAGKTAKASSNGFIPLTKSHPHLTANAQHHSSVAGPHTQSVTNTATLGHSQVPNSHLVQLPNHPLAPGNTQGHPSNVGFSSNAAGLSSVSSKQAQEASNAKPNWATKHSLPPSLFIQQQRHPAPLPSATEAVIKANGRALRLPPKPTLKISRVSQGIVLSWNMPSLVGVEVITSYQLFAYQETDSAPRTSLWKKVGDVRALPLPMACTLTQFLEGNKYHFAVRAVDKYNRTGAFSDPSSIFLGVGSTNTKISLRG